MARRSLRRALTLSVAGALWACGEPAPPPPDDLQGYRSASGAIEPETATYEQNFVFAGTAGDRTFLVPWILSTTSARDEERREAWGWLGRAGTWDAFYAARWTTPGTRAPARVLPYGELNLLVREEDVVDGIIFEDGVRRLELALGDVKATWGGPRGESVALVEGAAFLADERVEGSILHLARASTGGSVPGGDWMLLMSGDSMHVVLSADIEYGGEVDPLYRGWATLGDTELQWPEVRVDWGATQAFPPARRDIPSAWEIWAADGSIEGELTVVSADVRAGEGPGPLLPVRALFEVAGEIEAGEGRYPVRGLVVHERR